MRQEVSVCARTQETGSKGGILSPVQGCVPGGAGRRQRKGRRGSGATSGFPRVLPGAAGRFQPGLTWAAEHPGGSGAAETADRPGGHHLELKRTKVENAQMGAAVRRTFLPQPGPS